MSPSKTLTKQLEAQRFLHGVAYVEQSAGGPKNLTTSELAHLNDILTGNHHGDAWRMEPASVTIPSGHTHHFNVINNPIPLARDVIHHAEELAANRDFVGAALYLYSQLVLKHFFRDANRRTAALATLWLLQAEGAAVDAQALDGLVIGDLRNAADLESLRKNFESLVK